MRTPLPRHSHVHSTVVFVLMFMAFSILFFSAMDQNREPHPHIRSQTQTLEQLQTQILTQPQTQPKAQIQTQLQTQIQTQTPIPANGAVRQGHSDPSSHYTIDVVFATFLPPYVDAIDAERQWWDAQLDAITTDTFQNQSEWAATNRSARRYVIKHFFALCVGPHGIDGPDILLLDCVESYQQLHTKTSAYFKTIMTLVPGARYYGKRDSDAYPCMAQLLPICDRVWMATSTSQYVGGYIYNSPVFHHPRHKWYDRLMDEVAPNQNAYWPYHEGSFYLLSADLLRTVLRNEAYLQSYYMEDAMVGAWVLGITKSVIDVGLDQSCRCRGDAVIYHYCKYHSQLEACLERERERCFTMSGK